MYGALFARPVDKDIEIEKGRITLTIAKRYRRGVAPNCLESKFRSDFYDSDQKKLSEDHDENDIEENYRATAVSAPVILKLKADDRLLRLRRTEDNVKKDDRVRRNHVVNDEISSKGEKFKDDMSSDNFNDEEAILRKREEIRAGIIKNNAEDEFQPENNEKFESEKPIIDEEENPKAYVLKTFFIPKTHRETLKEIREIDQQIKKEKLDKKQRELERIQETKQIMAESLKKEIITAIDQKLDPSLLSPNSDFLNPYDINTDDELDDELEFERWRHREMERLKRDKTDRESIERNRMEQIRIRSMSESERWQYDKTNPKQDQKKERTKMKFLQKYYHKGAYFQEVADDRFGTVGTDPIYKRDFRSQLR